MKVQLQVVSSKPLPSTVGKKEVLHLSHKNCVCVAVKQQFFDTFLSARVKNFHKTIVPGYINFVSVRGSSAL